MTASTLARFRCSLSGVQATDCVKVNYTVARQGVNGSACMRAIQFFDIPEWESSGAARNFGRRSLASAGPYVPERLFRIDLEDLP